MLHEQPVGQQSADREADIARTLVRLADLAASADDEFALLEDVATSCVRILDGDAAGVSLGTNGHLGFVTATSERMDLIELFQAEHQQGPCIDAFRSGRPTRVPDLEAERDRWPDWTARAIQLGFRAAEAFPMSHDGRTIGVIDFYATRPRTLNDRDLVVGSLLAEMATVGLLGHRETDNLRSVTAQLQGALDSRVIIEQAKGTLGERHGLSVEAAFDRLRSYARQHRIKLRDVAEQVVHGSLDP